MSPAVVPGAGAHRLAAAAEPIHLRLEPIDLTEDRPSLSDVLVEAFRSAHRQAADRARLGATHDDAL